MAETLRLFSYGTLQQENVQLATFGRRLDGVADTLPGFERTMIEITDPEVLATSGERFHPIVRRCGIRRLALSGPSLRSRRTNWPRRIATKSRTTCVSPSR